MPKRRLKVATRWHGKSMKILASGLTRVDAAKSLGWGLQDPPLVTVRDSGWYGFMSQSVASLHPKPLLLCKSVWLYFSIDHSAIQVLSSLLRSGYPETATKARKSCHKVNGSRNKLKLLDTINRNWSFLLLQEWNNSKGSLSFNNIELSIDTG